MDLTLTGHYEDFIPVANALSNQADDFERLNERAFEGTNSRLEYKVRKLRQFAQEIEDQIFEHLHPVGKEEA